MVRYHDTDTDVSHVHVQQPEAEEPANQRPDNSQDSEVNQQVKALDNLGLVSILQSSGSSGV